MAFCNSCGAALISGANSCSKCGAAVAGAAPVAAAPPPLAPAPAAGTSALKVVLIVIAVIVSIGLLGIATLVFVGVHIARGSHVTQEGDKVKVDTPFGTFSANDPDDAVRDLGVDVYPGAQVQKNGAASVTVAGIHTVTANFASGDSADQVCAFYKSRFPSATVTSSDHNRCSIVANVVSGDEKNSMTINVESSGDSAKFQIAHVSRKTSPSN
jgi:hypothetical protein